MSESQKKGDRYTDQAEQLFSRLSLPGTRVLPKVEIRGLITDESREIDLQVIKPEEYDFLAIECKNTRRKVGSPTMEGFIKKLEDVGSKRGAFVANTDYTKGARNWAQKEGIQLFHLVDSTNTELKFRLSQKTLLIDHSVTALRLDSNAKAGDYADMMMDEIIVKNSVTGQQVSCLDIFKQAWNSEKSLVIDVGEQRMEVEVANLLVKDRKGEWYPLSRLNILYEVNGKCYEGSVPLDEVVGIYDVKNSSLLSYSLMTAPFNPIKAEREWKEVAYCANPVGYGIVHHIVSAFDSDQSDTSLVGDKSVISESTTLKIRLNSEDGFFELPGFDKN